MQFYSFNKKTASDYGWYVDLDGTLTTNTEMLHFQGCTQVIADEYGIKITRPKPELTGMGPVQVFRGLLSDFQIYPDSIEMNKLVRLRYQATKKIMEENDIHSSDGVEDFLKYIGTAALVTSGPREIVQIVLRKLGMNNGHFDPIVVKEDIPSEEYKPLPEPYRLAHERSPHSIPIEKCIAVEDSSPGVRSAAGAGMNCIGYRTEDVDPTTLKGAGAFTVITSLSEVNDQFIKNLSF